MLSGECQLTSAQHRNDAKYVKNKDRNHQRAIDMERRAIQEGAVRQAEKLASIHDLSGKMFNVGEMVIMPDGNVKSKDKLLQLEETKRKRAERENTWNEQKRLADEAFQSAKAALQERYAASGRELTVQEIKRLRGQNMPPRKISKKQQARQEALAPRSTPPKPIIPEGFSIPEGEEDFLALWDATDADLIKRINARKKEKKMAAKALRQVQKEKKKFNRAMKELKKQCARDGILWDEAKAKKEVLRQLSEDSDESDDEDDSDASENKDGSSSDADSDYSSDDDSDEEDSPKKAKIKFKGSKPKLDLDLLAKAAELEAAHREKKRLAKERRKRERKEKAQKEAAAAARLEEEQKALANAEKKAKKEALKAEEAAKAEFSDNASSKKRKRNKDEEEIGNLIGELVNGDAPAKKSKRVQEEHVATETNGKGASSKDKSIAPVTKVEPEEDEEAKAAREKKEKKERKKAKKLEKAKTQSEVDPKPENMESEPKHKKHKKPKLPESNDDKLDQDIVAREAKTRVQDASQWNPEALDGDEARKSKFMRLLGAGKNTAGSEKPLKVSKGGKDITKTAEEIARVQSELERQYESGMKMKHDGGSKRRGLGA